MDTPTPTPAAPEAPARRCQNCGEPLLGEHCYSCGQPTKGLVRHFSSIVGDFMDSVFELDSRILRTLGPLLLRPGYLTLEYFAGRRVRYVSPVRLFVFLSLLAFFAAKLSVNIDVDEGGTPPVIVDTTDDPGDGIRNATTVAGVEAARDEAIAALRKVRAETANVGVPGMAEGVSAGMEAAEKGVAAEAARRIAVIEKATREGKPVPPADNDANISFNGSSWDPKTNPLKFDALPDAANDRLNGMVGDAKDNIARIQKDPNLLKDAFLSNVPTTLFALLPLFALLLKFAYLFKRRIYMEHLIVALHSHAFLCAGLLLVLLLDALAGWTTALPWLSGPLGIAEFALVAWLPIYLLLMQKRVYGQGWVMTLLKYGVLGTCYFVLVSLGATLSLLVSLVNM
ncbi:MAG TPA: DUF3667 domain-containing protein [Arenimonas sp.]|nr:DUF3667 domain-containing protein [Arenimonas sp.]